MPVNPNLDVNYTAAQVTTIETALNAAITEIKTVIVVPLNLSDDERGDVQSVDVQREPFVNDAVVNLGPMFPNMLGPDITQARATRLWEFRNSNRNFLALVDQLYDLLTDSEINAENIALKFTEDIRDNGQRYKGRSVTGADVVWDRLKDLHKIEATEPTPVVP